MSPTKKILGDKSNYPKADPDLTARLIKQFGEDYIPKVKEEPVEVEGEIPTIQDIDGFEYVPSLQLYIAKEKELHSHDWNQAKDALHQREDRMPTLYEFTEFIKHLRTKKDAVARTILSEIHEIRDPWRGEWLDARFEKQGDKWLMYYHVFSGSGIEEKTQDLTGVLLESKHPGIDFNSWLNDNRDGLPKRGINDGELWYWRPRDGKVAKFDANLGRADLDCVRGPSHSYVSIGVRAVRRPPKTTGGSK